jgi:hypothetical protein
VKNDSNAIFIESVTGSPRGNLLGINGPTFCPQATIDRLTVAMAMVKLLYTDQEVQAAGLKNPGLADWDSIPAWARGYASLAVSSGMMSADGAGNFRPNNSITRVELAVAAARLQQLTR